MGIGKNILQGVRSLFGKPTANQTPSNLDIIQFNSTTQKWELVSGVIGAAVQTSSNVGTGEGVALPRVGDDLPFKSLLEGLNLDISSNATEIIIKTKDFFDLPEIAEPADPAASTGRLWIDPATVINDTARLVMKDDSGVVFDCMSGGFILNTYNTEAIGGNHYLALSGLNSSNGTFLNRAVILPRSARFYNLYVEVAQNGTTIVTNCALNDGAASPTVLDVDIPIGTTGTFFNADDHVDLVATDQVAYGFGLTTGGTLAIASIGMAVDILRVFP